jgi:hypothetical protein
MSGEFEYLFGKSSPMPLKRPPEDDNEKCATCLYNDDTDGCVHYDCTGEWCDCDHSGWEPKED